ncbi:hypothetical protein NEFER03_1430 [Nematocida sp. LUAm3]|nr:hypothetical protein NEFER03_1430 [Nematocida sp. LUAm3]KAI5174740.1 hypothetical protein NEFER02_0850 [Nematocida sp. LUAm2]KAI5177849.1 hypothetical protein NEFER01_1051 [Nematocida sp. LUAm1]
MAYEENITFSEALKTIKEQRETETTKEQLQNLCKNVNIDKYFDAQLQDLPPKYIAIVEEEILYPKSYSRENLQQTYGEINKYIEKVHMVYVHKILANTLLTSHQNEYTDEYDRWLVLLVVKLLSAHQDDSISLLYFPVIVARIDRTDSAFRDRAVILSDYITNRELVHQSKETTYFCNDIPLKSTVEEVDESIEEEDSTEEPVTTLSEYKDLITEEKLKKYSDKKRNRIIESGKWAIKGATEKELQKHAFSLIESLLPLSTAESFQIAADLVAHSNTSLQVIKQVYNRNKYSLATRKLFVLSVLSSLPRIREDILKQIYDHIRKNEHSLTEEDKKLKIDILCNSLEIYSHSFLP